MLANKQLKQLVHNHIHNNNSKDYVLGIVYGLFIGNSINKTQATNIQNYINLCYK